MIFKLGERAGWFSRPVVVQIGLSVLGGVVPCVVLLEDKIRIDLTYFLERIIQSRTVFAELNLFAIQ